MGILFKIRFYLKLIYALLFIIRPNNSLGGARILLYHSIPKAGIPQFTRQLVFIRKKYHILKLSELVDKINKNESVDERYVVITFDDGFKDNFLNAVPVLIELGIPATFFITTDFIDYSESDKLKDFFRQAYPGVKEFNPSMSWADLEVLSDKGFEIGSHTISHPNLANCYAEQITREISESKRIIESRIGKEVKHFSFPFGTKAHASANLIDVVKKTGYQSCSSAIRGANRSDADIYFLHRDNIEPDWPVFLVKAILAGAFDRRDA